MASEGGVLLKGKGLCLSRVNSFSSVLHSFPLRVLELLGIGFIVIVVNSSIHGPKNVASSDGVIHFDFQ